ncbi:VOC family protein [Mesorhizobium sp. BAC0120]|uniref:VOC family protein n=1 Tax=Mesorhizobium sp. BAC0120 TaxID=3090670 RepID=UPI00298BDAAE|nr:VOC family protein [Mesorhizobium sp. BAC0120]MDW6022392.1 VOC family protein [Mesorhizobium sp. BAC0120]
MILNHVNRSVTDVQAAKSFLETYFGLKELGGGNQNRAFMKDDHGLVLSLFKAKEVSYPATFHIQDSEEKVNEVNRRLKDEGFDVAEPRQLHGWTFYVKAPGGFTVEVLA